MTDFVRVKLENGSEATLSREFAEKAGVKILNGKPAVDQRGEALNAKHQADLSTGGKYAGVKTEDLQADADLRGLTVEGTGKDGNILKTDLVAGLEAHDAANGAT